MATRRTKRDHYRKYFQVQERLVQCLEENCSAKDAAKELGISLPTFYKYKSIASVENDMVYMTEEEVRYIRGQQVNAEAFGQPLTRMQKRIRDRK